MPSLLEMLMEGPIYAHIESEEERRRLIKQAIRKSANSSIAIEYPTTKKESK